MRAPIFFLRGCGGGGNWRVLHIQTGTCLAHQSAGRSLSGQPSRAPSWNAPTHAPVATKLEQAPLKESVLLLRPAAADDGVVLVHDLKKRVSQIPFRERRREAKRKLGSQRGSEREAGGRRGESGKMRGVRGERVSGSPAWKQRGDAGNRREAVPARGVGDGALRSRRLSSTARAINSSKTSIYTPR